MRFCQKKLLNFARQLYQVCYHSYMVKIEKTMLVQSHFYYSTKRISTSFNDLTILNFVFVKAFSLLLTMSMFKITNNQGPRETLATD